MSLVSIIIAAYNIEDYIERCLETAISQTYRNLEIIVVNDGSTDNTLQKINNYLEKDNRIKVINKKNAGLIEARLSGFKEAKGKYILFIDGDDWLEKDAIEILYLESEKFKCDIVCFDYIEDFGENNFNYIENKQNYEVYKCENFLKKVLTGRVVNSIWSKFIRREFFYENNINWPRNITFAEDLALSCSLAINNPKVIIIEAKLYHYYQRSDSITKKVSDSIYDVNNAVNFVKKELNNKKILTMYKYEFEYLEFMHNFYFRVPIISEFKSQYSKNLYNIWKKNNVNIKNNSYITDKLKNESLSSRFYFKILNKNYYMGEYYFRMKSFIKQII